MPLTYLKDCNKMLNESERLELKTVAPFLLAHVLFDVNILNQISKFRNLLLHFCANDKQAQRHLLGGIGRLIYNHKDALLPKTVHIIKALYDEDICSEESLLCWGKKVNFLFSFTLIYEIFSHTTPMSLRIFH